MQEELDIKKEELELAAKNLSLVNKSRQDISGISEEEINSHVVQAFESTKEFKV